MGNFIFGVEGYFTHPYSIEIKDDRSNHEIPAEMVAIIWGVGLLGPRNWPLLGSWLNVPLEGLCSVPPLCSDSGRSPLKPLGMCYNNGHICAEGCAEKPLHSRRYVLYQLELDL